MKVSTSAIQNGAFADRFGKRGSQFSPNGMNRTARTFAIFGEFFCPLLIKN